MSTFFHLCGTEWAWRRFAEVRFGGAAGTLIGSCLRFVEKKKISRRMAEERCNPSP